MFYMKSDKCRTYVSYIFNPNLVSGVVCNYLQTNILLHFSWDISPFPLLFLLILALSDIWTCVNSTLIKRRYPSMPAFL